MQLKQKNVRQALAVATSTLLTSVALVDGVVARDIDADATQLYYSEKDRVTVHKSQVSASAALGEDETVSLDLIFDTMSGSSPNGRYVFDDTTYVLPATSASGRKILDTTGSTQTSKTWLTPFEETRLAASGQWLRTWMRNFRSVLGLNASVERDYRSLGGSAQFELDVDQKRTTLVAGAGLNVDTIKPEIDIPEGGTPLLCTELGFASIPSWLDCNTFTERYATGNKVVTDYLFGVTQVWNRHTLLQFNYSFGEMRGYLSDPYKTVSVIKFDEAAANPQHRETAVVYEKRPDNRNVARFFARMVYARERESMHLSYRYYWDNWEVRSHTFDMNLIVRHTEKHFFEPHFRVNKQSAAFFYTGAIDAVNSDLNEPKYMSADHRLGEQVTYTVGLKYGIKYNSTTDLAIRVDKMTQEYRSGTLPNMSAWITQVFVSATF